MVMFADRFTCQARTNDVVIMLKSTVGHAQADSLAKTRLQRCRLVCLKMKHARRHDGIVNKPVHPPDPAP
jgi:hypothetical protein